MVVWVLISLPSKNWVNTREARNSIILIKMVKWFNSRWRINKKERFQNIVTMKKILENEENMNSLKKKMWKILAKIISEFANQSVHRLLQKVTTWLIPLPIAIILQIIPPIVNTLQIMWTIVTFVSHFTKPI